MYQDPDSNKELPTFSDYVAFLSGSAPIKDEGYLRRVLHDSVIVNPDSIQLHKQQVQRAVERELVNSYTKLPNISAPESLPDEARRRIAADWGDYFYITYDKGTKPSPHAESALRRLLSHYFMLHTAGIWPLGNIRSSGPIWKEIGANDYFALTHDFHGCHSCCPVVSLDDKVRRAWLERQIRMLRPKDSFQTEFQNRLIAKDPSVVCHSRAELCRVKADVLICSFSTFDVGFTDNLVMMMDSANAEILFGDIIFTWDMLSKERGYIESENFRWEKTCVDGEWFITFYFADNNYQRSYVHNWEVYLTHLRMRPMRSFNSPNVFYVPSIIRTVGATLIFRVQRVSGYIPRSLSEFRIPLTNHFSQDSYVLFSYELVTGKAGPKIVPTIDFDISPEPIERALATAMKSGKNNLTIENVFDALASANYEKIVNGVSLAADKDKKMPYRQMVRLAVVIYLDVYETRYNISQLQTVMKADIDAERGNGDSLIRRFFNAAYRKYWPFGQAALCRKFDAITADIQPDIDYAKYLDHMKFVNEVKQENGFFAWVDKLFLAKRMFSVGMKKGFSYVKMSEFVDSYTAQEEAFQCTWYREPIPLTEDLSLVDNYIDSRLPVEDTIHKPITDFETIMAGCLCPNDSYDIIHNDSQGTCFYQSIIDLKLDKDISEVRGRLSTSAHIDSFSSELSTYFKHILDLNVDPSTRWPVLSLLMLVAREYNVNICAHYDDGTCRTYKVGSARTAHFFVDDNHISAMRRKPSLPYVTVFRISDSAGDINLTAAVGDIEDDPLLEIKTQYSALPDFNERSMALDPIKNLQSIKSICRSEFKLMEHFYRFPDLLNTDSVLDMGSAPGSWLRIWMLKTKAQILSITKKDLIPINEKKLPRSYTMVPGFLHDSLCDLTNRDDIEAFKRFTLQQFPDGVMTCSGDAMVEDYFNNPAGALTLMRSQVEIALAVTADGGSLILKFVFPHHSFTKYLMAILEKSYVTVNVYRPFTEKLTAGEFYVVATGYDSTKGAMYSNSFAVDRMPIVTVSKSWINHINEIMTHFVEEQHHGLQLAIDGISEINQDPELFNDMIHLLTTRNMGLGFNHSYAIPAIVAAAAYMAHRYLKPNAQPVVKKYYPDFTIDSSKPLVSMSQTSIRVQLNIDIAAMIDDLSKHPHHLRKYILNGLIKHHPDPSYRVTNDVGSPPYWYDDKIIIPKVEKKKSNVIKKQQQPIVQPLTQDDLELEDVLDSIEPEDHDQSNLEVIEHEPTIDRIRQNSVERKHRSASPPRVRPRLYSRGKPCVPLVSPPMASRVPIPSEPIVAEKSRPIVRQLSQSSTNFVKFFGDAFEYSNFYNMPVIVEGIMYRTSEHAYQCMKAIYHGKLALYNAIKNSATPSAARSRGQFGPLITNWEVDKITVMAAVLSKKFIRPMDSPGTIFVECNPKDGFWGTKLFITNLHNNNVNTWKGLNMLGKVLSVINDYHHGIHKCPSWIDPIHYRSICKGIRSVSEPYKLIDSLIHAVDLPKGQPLSELGEEFLVNAPAEYLDILRVTHAEAIKQHSEYYDAYVNSGNKKRMLSSFSKGEDEFFGMLKTKNDWIIKPLVRTEYRMAYSCRLKIFVPFSSITADNGPFLVSNYTQIANEGEIYENLKDVSIKRDIDIATFAAGPGCRKTQYLVENAFMFVNDNQQLYSSVLSPDGSRGMAVAVFATRGAKNNAADRVAQRFLKTTGRELSDKIKDTYFRTFDSLFMHGPKSSATITELWVDEALMQHFGAVMYAASLLKVKKIFALGDFLQIPYICRVKAYVDRYKSIIGRVKISQVLDTCYRCPLDVVAVLAKLYTNFARTHSTVMNFKGTSNIVRSMKTTLISGLDSLKRDFTCQYLVFTQADKMAVNDWLFGNISDEEKDRRHKIMMTHGVIPCQTVHEYQGNQCAKVKCIRLSVKMNDIAFAKQTQGYDHNPHALVAISRHTESFEYLTASTELDAVAELVEEAKKLSDPSIMQFKALRQSQELGYVSFDPYITYHRVQLEKMHHMPISTLLFDNADYGFCNRIMFAPCSRVIVRRSGRHICVRLPSNFLSYRRIKQAEFMREAAEAFPVGSIVRIDASIICEANYTEQFSNILYSTLHKKDLYYTCHSRFFIDTISPQENRINYTEPHTTAPADIIHTIYPINPPPVLKPNYGSRDVSLIQSFLDREFGNTISQTYWTDHFNNCDITIDTGAPCKLNLLNMTAPVPKFQKLRPKLLGPMPALKPRSLMETLYAYKKRNGARPKLEGLGSPWTVASSMILAIKKCFDPDNFAKVTSEFIKLSPEALHEAAKSQTPEARRNLKFDKPLHEMAGDKCSYEIKRAAKPPELYEDTLTYPAPQTIVYPSKEVNILSCSIWRQIRDRATAALSDKFLIYSQMSHDEFARVVSSMHPPHTLRHLKTLELDVKKYDKSQGLVALLFECMFMREFLTPEWFIDYWFETHLETALRDPNTFFKSRFEFQRRSGDASTFFGNTMFLLGVIATIYGADAIEFAMISGDDSLLFGKHFADYTFKMATMFNLEVKFIDVYKDSLYFCSKFLIAHDDYTWLLLPNPKKLALKLCRSDMVNFEHVRLYHISYCDHVQQYASSDVRTKLSDAYRDRYHLPYSIESVLEVLFSLTDFELFKTLFIHDPGTEIDERAYLFPRFD